jgi:hypothetical protein
MEQTNISQISLVELKALAYDQMSQIEFCQNNLKIINQEFTRRMQQPSPQQLEPLPQGSIQRG